MKPPIKDSDTRVAARPASGDSQVVVTFEFGDMAAWADWYGHDDVQQVIDELRKVATDLTLELWGPSPIMPQPVRPDG